MEYKKQFRGEIEKMAEKITKYGRIIEPALGLPALVIFVLHLKSLMYGTDLLFFLSLSLASYYFLEAFANTGEEGGMPIFLTKLSGIGSSIATVGLLYHVGTYPGATEMMLVGALSLIFAMVFFIATGLKSATKCPIKTRRSIRILLLIALMSWVFAKDGITLFS